MAIGPQIKNEQQEFEAVELQEELLQLRERLFELEELEVSRVTEEQERFDALQVLDEYAKQLEESRDKLTRLFKAAHAVQEARTIQEALQKIAEAVMDAGWGSVSVSLFKNWQIVQAAYAGCTIEDIEFLESNRRSSAERARLYGTEFDRFRTGRSYFVPAEELPGLIPVDTVCPGRREVQPGDEWNPMDLAYVPLFGSGNRVIGCINCDDPVDGKRPTPDTFTYLELFADIAASKVETTRLLEQQRRTAEAYRESEEKYRALFSRSGDGYLLIDDSIRDCNHKACEIFGCSRHELLGTTFASHAPETQPGGLLSTKVASHCFDRATVGGSEAISWVIRRKNGESAQSEVSVSNVEIGGESLLLVVVRDVSDKKKTEAALEESETRFRATADATPLLIWMSAPDCTMTFFNKRWLDFTGKSMDELCGLGWEAEVHPDDLSMVKQAIQLVHDEHVKSEIEYRLKRSDGQYRWFLNISGPRFDSQGSFLGYVGTCIEIDQKIREAKSNNVVTQISKLLLSSDSMPAVYSELPEILRTWSGYPLVNIDLRDTTSSELVSVGRCGFAKDGPKRVPLTDSPPAEAALTGQPVYSEPPEEGSSPSSNPWAESQGIGAFLSVPITLKNRVLGVITLADLAARKDMPEILDSLEVIADALAMALERRRAEEENVRLAAFQRENPNLAIACDARGNVTYVNPTGINLLKEHKLQLFPGLLPPDHKPLVKRCATENTPIHGVITRAANRTISWSYYYVPSVQTVHMIGVDMTDKVQLEELAASREQRRRAILEAAPDGIVTINEAGLIMEFNPAAEKLLGFSADELTGRTLTDTIVPPLMREAHSHGIMRYRSTGQKNMIGRPVKTMALCKDGREIPVEIIITEIEAGAKRYFTAFMRADRSPTAPDSITNESSSTSVDFSLNAIQNLTNTISVPVAVVDVAQELLIVCNTQWAEFAGCDCMNDTATEHKCMLSECVLHEDLPNLRAQLHTTLAHGDTTILACRMQAARGEARKVTLKLSPISSGKGAENPLVALMIV